MATMPDPARPLVVERMLALAVDHDREGRSEEAGRLYREVLGAQPANVDALFGLAAVRHGEGAHDEALRLLEAARAEAPEDGRVGAALTEARTRAGRSAPLQRTLTQRVLRRFVRPHVQTLAQRPRVWKYEVLSCGTRVSGSPLRHQPVLFVGAGQILLGEAVQFGWPASPLFYAGYCHVEAAPEHAVIELGDRVEFNNNAMLKSEGAGIRVGADGLFGANVEIFDSNFHDLHPARRRGGTVRMAPVDIGPNVFVGMSVKILKGVTIGADSVIGAGAVVTSSIPAGVVAAGNPARVIRAL
jgi:acetyltransferase-like isoleucine patch superfamily enzyme